MFKTLSIATIVAGSLLASIATGQARQISVWGNSFTVEDGAAALPAAPIGPRFNATVDRPERFMRHRRRLDDLN